ncbi:Crp/Fnr family transcriptional regulator [Ideonella sp. 4Y16]|uniref:Crp/Fnr family transcriptional regulator n=1 Tax=Ideonella alba TaxID=2824118 RepID=A0A940Y7L9_9BURK|nr:Crp/Fnr family transcriptional regulator [Ideonella alba]MBQ0930156.1 Crp/Fnr family transcriptional regulator [Ideonella alba]MBQ0943224.1 Crp/Fnr family transcriptional regulator [Ideonella alba]
MHDFFKRLFGRSSSTTAARPDDQGFYATQFVERHADTQLYVHWAQRAPDLKAEPYDSALGVLALVRLLGSDRQLADLGTEQLSVLGGYLDYVQIESGKLIIGQEEQGDFMMVVLHGMLVETRLQPSGERIRLGEARAGDLLGEFSALDSETRVSSWTAASPVTLAVISASTLERMTQEDPRLAAALLTWLGKRVSRRLRQANARLGAQLTRGTAD